MILLTLIRYNYVVLVSSINGYYLQGLIELQKAQRTARQVVEWETDHDKRKRVVDLTIRYSKGTKANGSFNDTIMYHCAILLFIYLACKAHIKNEPNQMLSSARLSVQGVITKLKVLHMYMY